VHQLTRGRFDLLRWLTLVPALFPAAVMVPVLMTALATAGATDPWDTPRLASLVSGYRIVLGPALIPAVAFLCVAAAMKGERRQTEPRYASSLPLADAAAGLAFLAIPALLVTTGLLSGGPFVPRYGIAALIGVGVLAAGGAIFVERRRPRLSAIFLCALIVGFVFQIAHRWRRIDPPFQVPEVLSVDHTDLPIIVEGPLDYLQLTYYAPSPVRERLVSLVDPASAALFVGTRRGDLSLARLQPFTPALRIEQPSAFFGRHQHFLVFRGVEPGWVLAKLVDEGARATLVRYRNTQAMFDVRLSEGRATSSHVDRHAGSP
jgi:hypothetical protein